ALLASIGVIVASTPAAISHAEDKPGNAAKGLILFRRYCSNCHTLKAAGAHGHLGPDLDKLKPSYAQVLTQLKTGGTQGAGLPPSDLTFGPGIHTFSEQDMRDLATFVVRATHR